MDSSSADLAFQVDIAAIFLKGKGASRKSRPLTGLWNARRFKLLSVQSESSFLIGTVLPHGRKRPCVSALGGSGGRAVVGSWRVVD